MLRRFLSNNQVYPDDVIVIESGINDILVRPAVCLSYHGSVTAWSIQATCALCHRAAEYYGPAELHTVLL